MTFPANTRRILLMCNAKYKFPDLLFLSKPGRAGLNFCDKKSRSPLAPALFFLKQNLTFINQSQFFPRYIFDIALRLDPLSKFVYFLRADFFIVYLLFQQLFLLGFGTDLLPQSPPLAVFISPLVLF